MNYNKTKNAIKIFLVCAPSAYLLGAFLIFDFSRYAGSQNESTYNGRSVAIGPEPRWWVPRVSDNLDVPGGYSYSPHNWPFIVWKPICISYLKIRGYEKPIEWR